MTRRRQKNECEPPKVNRILTEDYERILAAVTPSFRNMAGKEVFITGAAGFVGSYLMGLFCFANEHYFEQSCKVIGYDTMISPSRVVKGRDVDLLQCDAPIAYCGVNADYYVNLASIASAKVYLEKPEECMDSNIDATKGVLKLAKEHLDKCKSVLHFSSVQVYAEPSVIPTPEEYLGNIDFNGLNGPYDISKAASETLCQIYWRMHNVPVKVVRPFNIYGIGESLDDGRLVPNLIKCCLNNEPFTIYGAGLSTRSFLYISDAVLQCIAVMLDGEAGQAYNVGDGESEVTLNDFVYLAKAIIDARLEIQHVSNPEREAVTRRRPVTTKIEALCGKPKVGLAEGLARTYLYYGLERD